ncbi:SDR family oxidoreductase [Streptomyces sp. NPDC014864]
MALRYAEASAIAATVAHLASPDGPCITGASIHVDGGFTA